MRRLNAVVVNYKTPEDLEEFVDSWEKYSNTETDHLNIIDVQAEVPLRNLMSLNATYWNRTENEGYGGACNYGYQRFFQPAEIYAFFNADVILGERTLDQCCQALLDNPSWGVLGPFQHDGTLVTHGGILGTNTAPIQRGWHKKISDEYRDIRDDAVMVMGSAYFIKKDCLDEHMACPILNPSFGSKGPFPEAIFLFYEETLISYHIAAHGWKNVYYGEAECYHKWHGSIAKHGHDNAFTQSREVFRKFCDTHGIEHD